MWCDADHDNKPPHGHSLPYVSRDSILSQTSQTSWHNMIPSDCIFLHKRVITNLVRPAGLVCDYHKASHNQKHHKANRSDLSQIWKVYWNPKWIFSVVLLVNPLYTLKASSCCFDQHLNKDRPVLPADFNLWSGSLWALIIYSSIILLC